MFQDMVVLETFDPNEIVLLDYQILFYASSA